MSVRKDIGMSVMNAGERASGRTRMGNVRNVR
jgi:hypothetical protein